MDNHIIQGLWIGDSLSTVERLSLASFLDNGHEYHLYTYGTVTGVPDGVIIKDANIIIPESDIFYIKNGAFAGSVAPFSDIFRYKLLLDNGGWWADTDCICVRHFDFSQDFIFSSENFGRENRMTPNNGVIKVPRGSRIVEYCYTNGMTMDRESIKWSEAGPKLITKAISKFNLNSCIQPPQVFCPLACQTLTYMLVCDRSIFNLDGAYTIHLWNELWRRYKINKDATFPQESLFESLKRKYL